MEIALIVLAAIVVGVLLARKAAFKKSTYSSSQMIRFAGSSAEEVLTSNWEHDEYYSRMYKHASPELASHMYKNRSLLNQVLDERAQLLGDYLDLVDLSLGPQPFKLWPSHIYEIAGKLSCIKGNVPVVILVNAAKSELSLDGIKVLKREIQTKKSRD